MKTAEKLRIFCRVAALLNQANITWAVGASLLLSFKGVVGYHHDVDLVIDDDDVPAAKKLF